MKIPKTAFYPPEKKAKFIAKVLGEMYPNPPVPLEHYDAYSLLVSVLLSAQCTDKRVNQVTPHLFAQARTPQEMVLLTPAQIQDIIRPCGLSGQKSRAIHRLSEILLEKYNGLVPNSLEKLEELPGVGHKTASVVVSQFFGEPAFPVDTHIHRLAYRWGLSTGKNVIQTEKDLKALFPKENWNDLHIQIILFGREHCPARNHNPFECLICGKYGNPDYLEKYAQGN